MDIFSKRIDRKKILDIQTMRQASKSIYYPLIKSEKFSDEEMEQPKCAEELFKICHFFSVSCPKIPKDMTETEILMQFIMSETGIMRRKIVLEGQWWKDGATPLFCNTKEGSLIALLPATNGGYEFFQNETIIKVTGKNEGVFSRNCYCFYQPLENRSLTIKDFMLFLCKSFAISDAIWLLCISLMAGLFGMIMPMINQFVFHEVVPSGTSKEIFGISVLIIGSIFMQAFCNLARYMWVMRIGNKLELLAQNAVWSRILSLPIGFFKNYSSGELSQRASSVNQICSILGGQLIPTVLSSIFSFVYLFQIRLLSPVLIMPSFIIILVTLGVHIATAVLQIHQMSHNNQVESRLSGLIFQLLEGLTKIKVAGAEIRAFGKWAEVYSKLKIMPNKILIFSNAIRGFVSFGGTIALYFCAYQANMSASDYIAFNSAFSLFLAAITAIAGITSQIASLKPAIIMLKPILEEEPENTGYKKQITSLTGDIEINQVKFRYQKDMPFVLDGLNLHIRAGEYIGIVGSSGCGKSTLMRVLLGFEKPQSGSVYYDMQDIDGLDIRSVRHRIGVVLQNGKLFSGDIYSNIVICAPWLSVDDAWKAAERAGFAEDIRNMPMGMFTMISEGGSGLSGGQQQRLLIARALASNPDIVMFDEATSALDNITQAIVVKTLEEMKCTRLVIAHRLSTIKNCTRIIYLDNGKVIEDGTYEELMKLNGKFAQMAKRQIV